MSLSLRVQLVLISRCYTQNSSDVPRSTQDRRKRGSDGEPKALHQGRCSPSHSCSPGPFNNAAPSEGAANSQHQTAKLTFVELRPLAGSLEFVC